MDAAQKVFRNHYHLLPFRHSLANMLECQKRVVESGASTRKPSSVVVRWNHHRKRQRLLPDLVHNHSQFILRVLLELAGVATRHDVADSYQIKFRMALSVNGPGHFRKTHHSAVRLVSMSCECYDRIQYWARIL